MRSVIIYDELAELRNCPNQNLQTMLTVQEFLHLFATSSLCYVHFVFKYKHRYRPKNLEHYPYTETLLMGKMWNEDRMEVKYHHSVENSDITTVVHHMGIKIFSYVKMLIK